MLHKRHKLEVYATQEGIQVETCVYFKIVQTLVIIGYEPLIVKPHLVSLRSFDLALSVSLIPAENNS